ncbi:MAG TPA: tryptophan--tRNA ligase [Candidatus Saccharimonadales bacterium]|nr:tryptophan--tRNA ligase [Candidatus Saccharimonadales bacterium]
MKRVLSGIRANSDLTLGNYLGALKPWVELQSAAVAEDIEYFFFIPNLHSIAARIDPVDLRRRTLSNAALYLAAGLDPAKVTFYVQSQVPAHAELCWIFNNYVTVGELSRMTQYKDKTAKSGAEGQLASIFNYPILMAADILLYSANEVPVGNDQRQHVELARDIANRFNNLYGPTFTLPKATHPEAGARIMNLQNPASKMSKSDDDSSGNIMLTDSPELIRQKLSRAVTDSGSEIKAAKDKPAVSNLLEIFSAITGRGVSELEQAYAGKGYAEFKTDLAEAVVEHLEPIQHRHDELMSDERELLALLEDGRQKAGAIAEEKLSQVKQTIGLL